MPTIRTMTVTLPEDIAAALDESVSNGEFPTQNGALLDAAKRWHRRRERLTQQRDSIRQDIRAALDDPRPSLSLEDVGRHFRLLANRVPVPGDKKAKG